MCSYPANAVVGCVGLAMQQFPTSARGQQFEQSRSFRFHPGSYDERGGGPLVAEIGRSSRNELHCDSHAVRSQLRHGSTFIAVLFGRMQMLGTSARSRPKWRR